MLTQKSVIHLRFALRRVAIAAVLLLLGAPEALAQAVKGNHVYEHKETRDLVGLVNDAAALVQAKGEAAFPELRRPGSRWRQEQTYIFVLDPKGNMLVHLDPTMEGKNEIDLKDVNGRPIIRGLLSAASSLPGKTDGWYHYQWPVPSGLLPRWKSSFVRQVSDPAGKSYVVGSGMYNDRMEKSFVADLVKDAVGQVEKKGDAAFALFRDPTGPFMAKDTYVFVFDPNGLELVNPAFPNLEGRNLLPMKDSQGKPLVQEMLKVAQTRGSGWVDYLWPKPGESVPTQKSTYVSRAKVGDKWLLVGAGVYLADAPRAAQALTRMTAPELMALVRDGAALVEKQGEKAYPEFRKKGSRWFRDDTYFIAWSMDGTRTFHAADPSLEGQNGSAAKDVLGRPYGKMFLDVGASPSGEGWVHYMYPEPGKLFPIWKSAYLKRVTTPSGKQQLIGSAVYNMQMDKAFIEDVVNRAAQLVQAQGKAAFAQLRDKQGPFVFMDTYVFVDSPDGVELVNPAQPSLEGKNILGLKDLKGKEVAKELIATAMKDGAGWVEYYWYKPGNNEQARKQSYVRKVQSGQDIYIVGSGLYSDEERAQLTPRPSAGGGF